MADLKGKTAIVTGASSGIGKAIALRFAEEGARVALLARRKERLEAVKKEIEDKGGSAHVFVVDLTQPAEIKETFAAIRRTLKDVDILVNNAGVGVAGPLAESKLEHYEAVFNLNVRGLFLSTLEVLPSMLRRKSGAIVNIASIAGKMGLKNSALYCASKFAVMGLSESLLEEARESNVQVSAVCPGLVNTELFDRRGFFPGARSRAIRPEDVAQAALLCASGEGRGTIKELVIRPREPV